MFSFLTFCSEEVYETILDHMGSFNSAIEAKTRELIQNRNKRFFSLGVEGQNSPRRNARDKIQRGRREHFHPCTPLEALFANVFANIFFNFFKVSTYIRIFHF